MAVPNKPRKPRKLYKIEVAEGDSHGPTTYFATGEDAFDAYTDVMLYENNEGHHTHQNEYVASADVQEVDPTTEPKFVAWKCA